jgi:IclR family KDG regulon transcriptional repressor
VAGKIPIKSIARPYLEELFAECKETVNLGIINNNEVLFLDKIITKEPLRIDLEIGKRIPGYCSGLGKAIMAFSKNENLDKNDFVKFTDKTIGSIKELQDSLDEIRKDGYAFDDEEYITGLVCIAVPILDSDGKSIAAISVAVPKARLTDESMNRTIELLKITAEKITERSCK